jgi:hypothetical protein
MVIHFLADVVGTLFGLIVLGCVIALIKWPCGVPRKTYHSPFM